MYPLVRAALARKGWTHADLSEATNIKKRTLSNKLRGNTPITREEMIAIRDAVEPEKTIDELFRTDEEVGA